MKITPLALLPLVVALALLGGGCGDSGSTAKQATTATKAAPAAAAGPAAAVAPKCPAAWAADWRKLAKRINAAVYCPSWMPAPLDAKFDGEVFNGVNVSPKRAYLVSFVWQETTPSGGEEVHVNFRGYPGQAAIPVCEDTIVANGKILHPKMPCFDDARGQRRIGNSKVTIYTANQGVDSWHVLYAWHRNGSLYAISEHVVAPYTHKQVMANLDRMLKGLVLVKP